MQGTRKFNYKHLIMRFAVVTCNYSEFRKKNATAIEVWNQVIQN